ncbi:hypothetical protein BH20ACI4_BH20ACI4_27790 [soil metagenome]
MISLFGKRVLRGAILFILAVFCVFTADQLNSTKVEAQAKSDSTEITDVPFSLSLNGNNAALSVAHNNSLSMTGAMTLEAWVKPFDTIGSQVIIDRMTQNLVSGSGGYQLRIDNGVTAFMICPDNLRIRCVTTYGANTIQANRWQHIAAVFENGKTRVYFNGQIDGQRFKTTRSAGFAVGDMTIGATARGRNQFRGLIDELRICNAAIYNGSFSLSAQLTANQSTVGLWRFDNGSVNDWSTYNHQTTIVGMATFSPDVPSVGGSGFVLTDTPNVGESNVLNDVKTISPTEVWAVGSNASENCCRPLIPVALRWNGTQWNSTPVPLPEGGDGELISVDAARGSNNVWALGRARFPTGPFGYKDRGWLLRWDGTSWTTVTFFDDPVSPQFGISSVKSIAVVNDNDLWIVGSRFGGASWTLHWDGISLTTIPSPNIDSGNSLKDISVINSNDIWAVGSFIVIRWNGTEWQIVPGNLPRSMHLGGVAAVSPTEVWAVGTTTTCGPFMGCSSFDAIIRYDGTNWTVAPVEQFSANQVILNGISASGSNDVWVVGLADSKTLVLHYENGMFRRIQSENAPPSPNDFNQLFSVSALNPNEVWTVGFAVGIFNSQNGEIGGNLALRKSSGF